MPPRPSRDTNRYRPPTIAPGWNPAPVGAGVGAMVMPMVGALVSGSKVRPSSVVIGPRARSHDGWKPRALLNPTFPGRVYPQLVDARNESDSSNRSFLLKR